MSKAEDRAEKAYPQEMDGYCENNAAMRVGFKIGYHQAEKDNELTWEDVKEIYCIALNLRDHVGSSVFGQPFYDSESRKPTTLVVG